MPFDLAKTLISDTECYRGLWSIGFLRLSDRKKLVFHQTAGQPFTDEQRRRIHGIMAQNTVVGYNFLSYDAPMIAKALLGASCALLKATNDRIIAASLKYWNVEEALGLRIPREWDMVDLMEPQPNAFASLKTLNGRLHGRWMQDLPYPPDADLTPDQIEFVLDYMGNDLEATAGVFEAMIPALDLREALGNEYRRDFRSKSDSQIGEAIIKSQVEQITGQRAAKVPTPAGYAFPYKAPDWLKSDHPELRRVLERLATTQFIVKGNGKVDLPEWIGAVRIGDMNYAMGIGGLHSTEKERAVRADWRRSLIDFDVASYYPAIILGSGLYPRSLGPEFLRVYRSIRDKRIVAKRAGDKVTAEGLKIALNGCFGKLGSPYSVLYAPHLMIAVTLTGQLALLMLIARAEAAGIPVVSANTDGVVFHCPRDLEPRLLEITAEWERETGFELESTRYAALYSQSVNSYIAVKEDGKVKRKGSIQNPRAESPPDIRTQMMTSPSMNVCSDAVVALLTKGVPLADTIRSRADIRDFVTVVNVQGGGTWRGDYLGKVVRYIWSKDGAEILYKKPHPTTGNHKKVPKSDGCRPVMTLPEVLPADLDYDRYIAEAEEILRSIGAEDRPPEPAKVRVLKRDRMRWLELSVAA